MSRKSEEVGTYDDEKFVLIGILTWIIMNCEPIFKIRLTNPKTVQMFSNFLQFFRVRYLSKLFKITI